MNPKTFEAMVRGPKPKPSGKDVRKIRKMLREGVPPMSMPFDPGSVDKIYAKLPVGERQKIVKKVVQQKIDIDVTDDQADRVLSAAVGQMKKNFVPVQIVDPSPGPMLMKNFVRR